MGSNPSYFNDDNRPVELVSWDDCQEFVTKLNNLLSGQLPEDRLFRLPTEAEWEFAARGGTKSMGYAYSGSYNIDYVAWYQLNSYDSKEYDRRCTHDVATMTPNELGIYDMSGNVLEWCQDWYGSYSSSAQTNPTGPVSGSHLVIRGGAWNDPAPCCTVSYRRYQTSSWLHSCLGLRLAL
jgi:formylglycine-generating enzyme required for sulfatase activity